MHRYLAMRFFCSFHGSRSIAYRCVRVTLVQRVERKCGNIVLLRSCVPEYRLFLHSNVQHEYCLQITSPVGMSPPSVRTGGGTVCRVSFAQRAPSPRGCTGGTSWSVCQSEIARSSCCRTCSPPVCCSRCRCCFRSALGRGADVVWGRPTGHSGDNRDVHPSVRPVHL